MSHAQIIIDSPLGPLRLTANDGRLATLQWLEPSDAYQLTPRGEIREPVLAAAKDQLEGYFAGDAAAFDLPLLPLRNPHDAAVRRALLAIPPGSTATYGEIARDIGSVARAVGQGCRRNPIAIVVPCHRVVAAAGIGGFGGAVAGRNIDHKLRLLALEGAGISRPQPRRRVPARSAEQAAFDF